MSEIKTIHKIFFGDANNMKELKANSVDLMITSPPYPMIEMWDEVFSNQNPKIKEALQNKDGNHAFELMNQILDKVWDEVYRVLRPGGIACINIGDATRTINGDFKLYPSHTRIMHHCIRLGFQALPEILWRKQTNAPNKFMGSGMLPPGAYVTLEHEFILILRKGGKREFKKQEEKLRRQRSSFFWEERNLWFSDVWMDMKGAKQRLDDEGIRKRSAAFPFELAYRLINMFSVQGDVVLDPFLGTGTSMAAAMASCRNSIGYEIDPNFSNPLLARTNDIVEFSNQYINERLARHIAFVQERTMAKGELKYKNKHYGFPVMTRQELEIQINNLKSISKLSDQESEVSYNPNLQQEFCTDSEKIEQEIIKQNGRTRLSVDEQPIQQTLFD